MKHSDSLAAIGAALVKAQAEIKPVGKDGQNPHFRNRYATLDALTDFVRPILQKHGLVVIQGGVETERPGSSIEVETMLLHTSGEWIASSYVMPTEKATAQGAGSAITYGRRYGLSSLLALTTDEDDDGNQASVSGAKRDASPVPGLQSGGAQTGGAPKPKAASPGNPALGVAAGGAAVCPICAGKMYDNRETKRNPKAPDFVCQNGRCKGVIWRPKVEDAKRPVATAAGIGAEPESYPSVLLDQSDDLPF